MTPLCPCFGLTLCRIYILYASTHQNASNPCFVWQTCLFSVIIWAGIFIVFAGASNNVGAYVIEGATVLSKHCPNPSHLFSTGEIIKMSELQFGVDNAMSNLVVAIGIWFFKRYLKNVNWRLTQVWTGCLIAVLNLGWLIPIHCKTG